ncbi:MAG: hypothetical protein AB1331_09225 [Bacillota bacterium]
MNYREPAIGEIRYTHSTSEAFGDEPDGQPVTAAREGRPRPANWGGNAGAGLSSPWGGRPLSCYRAEEALSVTIAYEERDLYARLRR